VLAEHGYEPRREGRRILLGNCPFDDLARGHTGLVCGMNCDLFGGLAEGTQPRRLQARLDPSAARCCVVLDVI
jgi:predicted ArsR family transcriptional regulator